MVCDGANQPCAVRCVGVVRVQPCEGALTRLTLLKRINRSDMTGAAAEFGKWVLADGKELPGLVRRRGSGALREDGHYDVAMRIVRTGA